MSTVSEHLTADEQTLMTRRKSPDLTPRESLQLIEIQTRLLVYAKTAEGNDRDALLADCERLKADIAALDVNADIFVLNAVGQQAMALHHRVANLP